MPDVSAGSTRHPRECQGSMISPARVSAPSPGGVCGRIDPDLASGRPARRARPSSAAGMPEVFASLHAQTPWRQACWVTARDNDLTPLPVQECLKVRVGPLPLAPPPGNLADIRLCDGNDLHGDSPPESPANRTVASESIYPLPTVWSLGRANPPVSGRDVRSVVRRRRGLAGEYGPIAPLLRKSPVCATRGTRFDPGRCQDRRAPAAGTTPRSEERHG